MKPRKVSITLEVTSALPLAKLNKITSAVIEPAGVKIDVDQSKAFVVQPAGKSSEPTS